MSFIWDKSMIKMIDLDLVTYEVDYHNHRKFYVQNIIDYAGGTKEFMVLGFCADEIFFNIGDDWVKPYMKYTQDIKYSRPTFFPMNIKLLHITMVFYEKKTKKNYIILLMKKLDIQYDFLIDENNYITDEDGSWDYVINKLDYKDCSFSYDEFVCKELTYNLTQKLRNFQNTNNDDVILESLLKYHPKLQHQYNLLSSSNKSNRIIRLIELCYYDENDIVKIDDIHKRCTCDKCDKKNKIYIFLQGTHKRLGSESYVRFLCHDIIQTISNNM